MARLHFVLLPLPSWGHVRPLCVLAGRIVSEGDEIVVTVLMAPNLLEKARAEVSRQFSDGHEALKRIRIVSMFDLTETQIFQLTFLVIKPFAETYPAAYEKLHLEKPITCATTGTTFNVAPTPVAIIMDFFAVPQMQATRALSKTTQIIAWVTGGASTIIRLFGPESMGGLGNFGEKIDAEAKRTGGNPVEIGDKIFRHTDGTVVNIPGLPPMYDYEFFPQLPFDAPVAPIVRGGHVFLMGCDGVIISTAEAYEKESLDALESWLASLSKPFYALGPLLPPTFGTNLQIGQDDSKFKAFLDEMLSQHGEHCTVFISFGTVFWPTVYEYVQEVVEALLEKKAHFILCHASPFAKISDELRTRVENSGIGMLTIWSPQQFILNHPETGWFLTHGGHGGITESLSSGVPLICWPFDADQPAAAKHLTQNLNVAFELVEVRTGLGLTTPSYGSERVPRGTREAVGSEMRGVIDEMRGENGKEKRKNAERMKVELRMAWGERGPAKVAMRAFLAKCT
ncbi:UDP-Glycosyltransferase/glycogen phosphorylase [Mycena alexandri]|uniref:UDP-Glycosyltransferase/glycogen phosphorylase n=1 Tax=Mycena alexandri TaxID=1745969 RepID=A0AAD6TIH7_9AGAR|nr:UDP-Glycosyltransferase/glycogen phosphorylase [Mycena alexandri]